MLASKQARHTVIAATTIFQNTSGCGPATTFINFSIVSKIDQRLPVDCGLMSGAFKPRALRL
jgi:hypothetical protein